MGGVGASVSYHQDPLAERIIGDAGSGCAWACRSAQWLRPAIVDINKANVRDKATVLAIREAREPGLAARGQTASCQASSIVDAMRAVRDLCSTAVK